MVQQVDGYDIIDMRCSSLSYLLIRHSFLANRDIHEHEAWFFGYQGSLDGESFKLKGVLMRGQQLAVVS